MKQQTKMHSAPLRFQRAVGRQVTALVLVGKWELLPLLIVQL